MVNKKKQVVCVCRPFCYEGRENIPDSYVIFITENDVMGKNQAIYHIQRYVETNEGKELFCDGSHIIYVNGKYKGNDENRNF